MGYAADEISDLWPETLAEHSRAARKHPVVGDSFMFPSHAAQQRGLPSKASGATRDAFTKELDDREREAEDRLILPVGKSDPDFDDAEIDLQIAIGIDVEEKSMREERMMREAVKNSLQSLDDDSARASMSKTLSLQTQQRSVKTCDSHVKIILKRVALFPAGNQLMWSGSKIFFFFSSQTTVAACVKSSCKLSWDPVLSMLMVEITW